MVEHGPVKSVTLISDVEELFPDIEIDDLEAATGSVL